MRGGEGGGGQLAAGVDASLLTSHRYRDKGNNGKGQCDNVEREGTELPHATYDVTAA